MRKDLGPQDLGDLLEQPLVAMLATYRADGTALLSPVWHEWHEHDPPYRGIEVRGEARLQTDGVAAAVRRIATRYLGADAAAYAKNGGDDTIIRLEPGRLRAWDVADEP